MSISDSQRKATLKYVAEKQKQIMIKYKISEYEERIRPAITASGLPTATFIKKAIDEKIERDGKKAGN